MGNGIVVAELGGGPYRQTMCAYPQENGKYKIGNSLRVFKESEEYDALLGLDTRLTSLWESLNLHYKAENFVVCKRGDFYDLVDITAPIFSDFESQSDTIQVGKYRSLWGIHSADAIEKLLTKGLCSMVVDSVFSEQGYYLVKSNGCGDNNGLIKLDGTVVDRSSNCGADYIYINEKYFAVRIAEYNHYIPEVVIRVKPFSVQKKEAISKKFSCLHQIDEGVYEFSTGPENKYNEVGIYNFNINKCTKENLRTKNSPAKGLIYCKEVVENSNWDKQYLVILDTLEMLPKNETAVTGNIVWRKKDSDNKIFKYNATTKDFEEIPFAVAKSLGCPFAL